MDQALWLRAKNEIKDEEYTEFYKYQANAYDEPRLRLHFSADAPLAINALLFVPKENPERLGWGRIDPAVALYCRKVLIDPKPKDLLPDIASTGNSPTFSAPASCVVSPVERESSIRPRS